LSGPSLGGGNWLLSPNILTVAKKEKEEKGSKTGKGERKSFGGGGGGAKSLKVRLSWEIHRWEEEGQRGGGR